MRTRLTAGLIAALAALGLAACGSSSSTKTVTAQGGGGNSSASSSSSGGSSVGGATTLIGAGSTLVAPLLQGWASDYNTAYSVAITYGPIGSGGGITQITGRTVNFGASDAPLTIL